MTERSAVELQILRIVRDNPGSTSTEIAEDVGTFWVDVRLDLRALARDGLLVEDDDRWRTT